MNRWTLLLIVVGLGAAGMLNKDKISAMLSHKGAEPEAAVAQATPNPATEGRARAVKMYPALAVQGSPLNQRFLQLYNVLKDTEPDYLVPPDWPVRLAERAARELNASPMPGSQRPTEVSGSSLNNRPPGSASSTVPPSVQLPGLQGSALDQRPIKRH